MKICMIGNYQHFSGALEVFRNIARHAKAAGHQTAYVYHAARDGDIPPDLSMFDEVISCPNEGVHRDVYGPQLAEIANRFDVVHHSLLPQNWRFRFKEKCVRSQVETYHSFDGWKYCWQQYQHRLKAGAEKPPNVTVAVSEELRKVIAADMPTVEVRRIYNGVEIPAEIAAGGDYITYCGRISDGKGLDVWLRIAEEVHRRIPGAKFQWVGALSPHHEAFQFKWLQAAAPWLECVGFQTDLAPFYRRSKCLLLTSPSEGLPMTILEAGAHGIPTVAFKAGDIEETYPIIADDAEHAVNIIASMWNWPPAWFNGVDLHIVGMCARDRIIEKFSSRAMAEKYLAIYEEIRCA